jgi:hypothetical protein
MQVTSGFVKAVRTWRVLAACALGSAVPDQDPGLPSDPVGS